MKNILRRLTKQEKKNIEKEIKTFLKKIWINEDFRKYTIQIIPELAKMTNKKNNNKRSLLETCLHTGFSLTFKSSYFFDDKAEAFYMRINFDKGINEIMNNVDINEFIK